MPRGGRSGGSSFGRSGGGRSFGGGHSSFSSRGHSTFGKSHNTITHHTNRSTFNNHNRSTSTYSYNNRNNRSIFNRSKPRSFGTFHSSSYNYSYRSGINYRRPVGHSYGARKRFGGGTGGGGGGNISLSRNIVLPQPGGQFFENGRLSYYGNVSGLQTKFNALTIQQRMTITQATLSLTGLLIQQQSTCCKTFTLISGFFCIFPLFCFCCNCYKVSTEPLYGINDEEWGALAEVMRECRGLRTVRMWVQDNFINVNKTRLLERALEAVPLQRFTFENKVIGLDIDDDEYQSFDLLFGSLKANRYVLCSIMWDDQYFMTQNYQERSAPVPQPGQYVNNPILGQMMNPMMDPTMNPMVFGNNQVQVNIEMQPAHSFQIEGMTQQPPLQKQQQVPYYPPPPLPPQQQNDPFMMNFWNSNPFSMAQDSNTTSFGFKQ